MLEDWQQTRLAKQLQSLKQIAELVKMGEFSQRIHAPPAQEKCSDPSPSLERSLRRLQNLTFHVKSWKAEEKRVLAKVDYGRYSG